MSSKKMVKWSINDTNKVAKKAAEHIVYNNYNLVDAVSRAQQECLNSTLWKSTSSLNNLIYNASTPSLLRLTMFKEVNLLKNPKVEVTKVVTAPKVAIPVVEEPKTTVPTMTVPKVVAPVIMVPKSQADITVQKVEAPVAPSPTSDAQVVPTSYQKVEASIIDTIDFNGAFGKIVDDIADIFRVQLRSALSQVLKDELEHLSEKAALAKPIVSSTFDHKADVKKLPKILIVGLNGKQPGIIQTEFEGLFKFKFADANGIKAAAATSKHVDATIICADFVSHGIINAIKAEANNDVIEMQGGITAIRDELFKLMAKFDEKSK